MTELTDNIYYWGIEDSDSTAQSDFYFKESCPSMCNAYLVKGRKTALIDVVNEAFTDDYADIAPISDVDYLVCNYTGNEYVKSIKRILSINPNIEIIGTVAAIKHIKEMLNCPFKEHIAKNGELLDLGDGKILEFIAAPNMPWPDTMITYAKNDRFLFSGRMFSSYSIKYDEQSMKEYFDSILSAFKPFVRKTTERISALDITTICAANGPVLSNISECISNYLEWSKEKSSSIKKAAVVYPNSYGSTTLIAQFVVNKLESHGFDVKGYSLSENYDSAAEEIDEAEVLIFGTNTINKNASQRVLNLIASMNNLKNKGKHCFVFGSYGWGGEGLQLLYEYLKLLKLKVYDKPFGVWFNPTDEDYNKLSHYIDDFVENMTEEL